MDSHDSKDANDVIGALELVLNGAMLQNFFISESTITVEVNPDVTKLYDSPEYNNSTPVLFSIPTKHLLEIFKYWKQFLLL